MKVNKITGYGVIGKDRQCGRSTGLALKYISEAMLNPGVSVSVVDHHFSNEADRVLFRTLSVFLAKSGLEHFVLDAAKLTITFVLYEDRDEPLYVLKNEKLYKKCSRERIYIDGQEYLGV